MSSNSKRVTAVLARRASGAAGPHKGRKDLPRAARERAALKEGVDSHITI